MQAKGYQTRIGSLLLMIILVLFAGCAKPPTEKVTALQNSLSENESKGAATFAPSEHQRVTQKMAELNSLIEAKKYRQATVLADSLDTDMTALKTAVETNAPQAAQQAVAKANEQLSALKGLLAEENVKVLGAETAAKYQQQVADAEAKVASLQTSLDSGNYLEVYNNSAVANDLAAAVQSFNAELEQAKAAAAEKAAAKRPRRR